MPDHPISKSRYYLTIRHPRKAGRLPSHTVFSSPTFVTLAAAAEHITKLPQPLCDMLIPVRGDVLLIYAEDMAEGLRHLSWQAHYSKGQEITQ